MDNGSQVFPQQFLAPLCQVIPDKKYRRAVGVGCGMLGEQLGLSKNGSASRIRIVNDNLITYLLDLLGILRFSDPT